jgi:autotransporter-associated beta strand protein
MRTSRCFGPAVLAALALVCLTARPAAAQSPPPPDFVWNNFTSAGTLWGTGTNWVPAGPPPGGVNQVLGFGSSLLQTTGGYTSTYNLGTFDLNSLVFSSTAASNPSIVLTGNASTDTLRFNTSSTSTLPSIWQTGTGRVIIQNGTSTAGVTLNGGTTLQVLGGGLGELQLNATIVESGGSGGLLINQTGTAPLNTGSQVRLAGANAFTGGVTLTSGNLVVSSPAVSIVGTSGSSASSVSIVPTASPNSSLGASTGVLTVNGGSLQFDPTAGSIPANTAFLTGTTTAVPAQPGTFAVPNPVQLNGTLTLTGTNFNATTLATSPNITLSAPVGSIVASFGGAITGSGGITAAPTSGAINYAFTGASTFAGPVVIRPVGNTVTNFFLGTAASAGGQFSGTTSFTVTGNSSLTLNNNSGVLTRLNTTTAPDLTLNRANVSLFGNATADSTETFGTLTVNGTANVAAQANINLNTAAVTQLVTLNFTSLSRGGTGTLAFSATNMGIGTGLGEGAVRFLSDPGGSVGGGGGAGTTTRSILPYAYADAQAGGAGNATTNGFPFTTQFGLNSGPVLGLVRWDSTSQRVVPLSQATEYANNLFLARNAAPTANHRYASTSGAPSAFGVAGLIGPTTVNALVLDTNTAATNRVGVSLDGPGTLTVAGGAILSAFNGSANVLPTNASLINLGGLNFGSATGYIHAVANLTINSPITGTGGLVKSGFGTLALNGNNPFTGGLAVNSGIVQFTSDANLGAAGQPITLNGGLTGAFTFQPTNLFGPATATAVTINRPVTVGPAGANVTATFANANLTLGGSITGSGQILKAGAGVLTLTGNNTSLTGGLTVVNGAVAAGSDAALGAASAPLILAGGTFQPTASFATNRNVLLTAGTPVVFTNGWNLTLGGNITSQTNAATLLKDGAGDLVLTGVNTFTGGFQNGISGPAVRGTATASATNSGRTILTGANGSMPVAASVLSLVGGEVVLDNSAAVNNNRIGTVTVGLIGGNVTLIGNASAPVNEAIGALSINNANNQYGGTLTLVTPAGSGQSTTLTATSFSNQPAGSVGTLFVRGTNLGAGTGDRTAVVLGAAPALTNGLIPAMVGATSATSEPTDFLTTQTVSVPAPNSNQFALVPFTAYTAGTGALGAGSSTATYDVTGAASFTGASAANALRIRGGSVDVGGGTLTLSAGAILATGGTNGGITNGTLAFGTNVARLIVAAGSDLTLGTGLTGSGGFVKTGGGVLTLNAASAVTGVYGIGQGTLRYGVANAIPVATSLFVNSGATLDLNNNSATLALLQGYGNVNLGSGTLTLSSTTTPTIIYGGSLSGSGTLIKQNTNTLTLAGDSTAGFTGGVQVLAGTNTGVQQAGLVLLSAGALGTGTSPILLGDTTGTAQAAMALGPAVSSFTRDITVQAGSTPATPHTLAVGAQTVAFTGNISLGQTLRLTNYSTNLGGAALNGTISGAGGINVFFGSWTFNGNNTYQGGTTIGGFTTDTGVTAAIGVGSDSAFGNGTVMFTTFGGNLRADNGPRTLANAIVLNSGAYFGVAGTNNLTLNGTVDLSGATTAQTFNILSTATTTLNGTIQNGTGGINKNGPGVLVLTGANTYSGNTTVNAGTLIVNNTTGSGTGTGNVVVNSGAILGGTGTIGNGGAQAVTVSSGGVVRPGGSLTGIGTLTVNSGAGSNVTFAPGSTLQVNVGSSPTTAGRLNITGGGTADLSGLSTTAPMNIYLAISAGLTQGTPYSLTVVDSGAAPIVFPGGGFDPNLFSVTSDFPTTGLTVTNPTASTIVLNFTPVPEPGSVLLVAAGVAAAAGLRRRRAEGV